MQRLPHAIGLALLLVLVACGDDVTDCYEMRQAEGTRPSNGEFCLCTFLYPSGDPSTDPVGPPCNTKCQDRNGQSIPASDCTAVPPL